MKRFFTVVISLMMLIGIGFGQNDYRSKQSGNWNDVNTWEVKINGVWQNATDTPNETNSRLVTVNILSGITITAPVTVNNLQVSFLSLLTLNAPLSVKGVLKNNFSIANNAGIILLSDASGTGAIDGTSLANVNGSVTMQRYLPTKFGYKYFSSPFTGATVSEFGDDMDLTANFTTFYKYDENRVVSGTPVSGWVNYKTPTGVLEPLRGYAVNFGTDATPTTVDVTGVVNNGNINVPLYNNNNKYTKGYNLVGNPYPSPINWYASSGWTKTNIDDALYFFKASATEQYNGDYQTFINGVSSDGKVSNIIPAMQGFFVHVTDGQYPVNGALAMTNAVRTTNSTGVFTKGGETKGPSLMRFTAAFSDFLTNPDYSVVYFDSKATVEFNGQTDALKMMNSDKNVPNIYEISPMGTNTSIKAIPYGKDTTYNMELGLKTSRGGQIVIRIRDIEGDFVNMTKISIYDKEKNIEQDLTKGQEYTIQVTPGEIRGRLFLRFSNKVDDNIAITTTTAVDDRTIDNSTNIFTTSYGSMKVYTDKGGDLRLYNFNGQLVASYEIADGGEYEFTPNVGKGIMFANLIGNNNVIIKRAKLIFNN